MTLPPLHQKRTRILLLAATLHDALVDTKDQARGIPPSSRAPNHNRELWPHGSYPQLLRRLDQLKPRFPHWHQAFAEVYIEHGAHLTRGARGQVTGYWRPVVQHHPAHRDKGGRLKRRAHSTVEKRHVAFPLDLLVKADTFVEQLELAWRGAVNVPAVVSENAGYTRADGLRWDRRPRLREAAA